MFRSSTLVDNVVLALALLLIALAAWGSLR
jgi:hypothetical protein